MTPMRNKCLSLFIFTISWTSIGWCEAAEIWRVTLSKAVTPECESFPGESRIGTRKVSTIQNGNLIKLTDRHLVMFGEKTNAGFKVNYWKAFGAEDSRSRDGGSYIFSLRSGQKRANVRYKMFVDVIIEGQLIVNNYCEYTGTARKQ